MFMSLISISDGTAIAAVPSRSHKAASSSVRPGSPSYAAVVSGFVFFALVLFTLADFYLSVLPLVRLSHMPEICLLMFLPLLRLYLGLLRRLAVNPRLGEIKVALWDLVLFFEL